MRGEAQPRPDSPLLVLTGAGVSAESGVPTFRDAAGLWEGRRPEDVASPAAFHRDPLDVWKFYWERREKLLTLSPNPAHRAIAAWQEKFGDFPVVTQNIDGLHQLAGSRNVWELHGSLWIDRCVACGHERRVQTGRETGIPRCSCGAIYRPGVVWFGEALPETVLNNAFEAARNARRVLVIGTSNLVYPAALLPRLALEAGSEVIEFNPEPTPLTPHATRFIQGKAAQTLPTFNPGDGLE